MKKRYDRPMTAKQIAASSDDGIDFSDLPELDDRFWREAERVEPDRSQPVTIRVKKSVLDFFRSEGRGYQTRMNAVLEAYVRSRSAGD